MRRTIPKSDLRIRQLEGGVRESQSFQLSLNVHFRHVYPLRFSLHQGPLSGRY